MTRKYRIILYCVVGITIPLLSYLIYPELGLWEPLSFTLLVVVVGSVYEVINRHKK